MRVTNLPDALLLKCMSFVGEGYFVFVAGTCRSFRDTYKSYLRLDGQKPTATNTEVIVSSVTCVQMAINELNINDPDPFLTAVIRCATYNGNLTVLKWLKYTYVDWYGKIAWSLCNEAARGGQLKVLQWLRSENGGKCGCCRFETLDGWLHVVVGYKW